MRQLPVYSNIFSKVLQPIFRGSSTLPEGQCSLSLTWTLSLRQKTRHILQLQATPEILLVPMWFFLTQILLFCSLKRPSRPAGFLRTVLAIYCECFPSLVTLLHEANIMEVGSTADNFRVLLQKFFEISMLLSVKDHRLAFSQVVF